jgi:putative transposase
VAPAEAAGTPADLRRAHLAARGVGAPVHPPDPGPRDAKLTDAFDTVFAATGINIATATATPQTPRMNAFAERFARTARAESTDHTLIASRRHLHIALDEFIKHYNTGPSHQAHDLALRTSNNDPNVTPLPTQSERIQRRTALGALTNEHQQAA